jgi:Cu/Zn superoxide dismutase
MPRWHRPIRLAVGCGLLAVVAVAPAARAQTQNLTLTMTSQNNSGITGTATFTDLGGGKTRVALQLSGAGSGPEPAHIHGGSCAQLDPTPAFTLTNVVNGSSTTDVESTLAQLTSRPYAVHVHKSQDELTVYVACADIAGSAQPATLPRSGDLGGPWPAAAAAAAGIALMAIGLGLRQRARPRTANRRQ